MSSQLNFEQQYDYYDQVRQDLGLKAIWSLYEVENLSDRHLFEGVETVTYKNHWGNRPIVKAIAGGTWAALYVAADAAIRDSGDQHHVYIEQFKQVGNTLLLTTGS